MFRVDVLLNISSHDVNGVLVVLMKPPLYINTFHELTFARYFRDWYRFYVITKRLESNI